MKTLAVLRDRKTALVIDMLLTLLTLPMALGYLTNEVEQTLEPLTLRIMLCTLFLALAAARLFRSRRMRMTGEPRDRWIMQRVYAVGFLICSLLPVFFGYNSQVSIENLPEAGFAFTWDIRQVTGIAYWTLMLIGRIASIIRKHTWKNIVKNAILILVILYFMFTSVLACELLFVSLTIAISSFITIMSVIFSRIRIDMLRKIIRKTYAMEIILGLLLLICAFSYVLKFLEDSIPTFTDGLWYCFAIVTTIGFGDITAVTLVGRILSIILGVYGIIVVSLITSIIVNFYGEMKRTGDDDDDDADSADDGQKAADPEEPKQKPEA